MSEQKVDRRVRKTKQQLRQGLTELLLEKPAKDITVRELADKVDMNRGTFYLHYKDIFDMVEQLENELFERFSEIVDKSLSREDDGAPHKLLENVFQFFADNADMGAMLLGPHGDLAFVNRIKQLVRDRCLHNWMRTFDANKSVLFEPYFDFVVGGIISLFQSWLATGLKQAPAEMAEMSERFIVEGISVLKKEQDA